MRGTPESLSPAATDLPEERPPAFLSFCRRGRTEDPVSILSAAASRAISHGEVSGPMHEANETAPETMCQ